VGEWWGPVPEFKIERVDAPCPVVKIDRIFWRVVRGTRGCSGQIFLEIVSAGCVELRRLCGSVLD